MARTPRTKAERNRAKHATRKARCARKVKAILDFLAWIAGDDAPECACCWTTDDLTVDHIRGRKEGSPPPRKVSYETRLGQYLIEAWEDPTSLRILCRSCNSAYVPDCPETLQDLRAESSDGLRWMAHLLEDDSYLRLPGHFLPDVPF